MVGSIQYTNDLDVHIALITAQSYAKERAEKYYMSSKTNHQIIREYIDLFGFMSKNPNAMDIMIEEARSILRTWGAAEPNFLLMNSKLTFQMTMIPEKMQYLTQGPDGQRKLREGPDIASYRGLKIINSRSFSMEEGAPPRDVLRRRVRVAEYYRIPYEEGVEDRLFAFYDESKDAWQKFTWHELERMAMVGDMREMDSESADWDDDDEYYKKRVTKLPNYHPGVTESVDFYMSDELFRHMTVGEIEGGIGPGYALADTGNLVLNPWYALHCFDVYAGGARAGLVVPQDGGIALPTPANARGTADAANMLWVVPHITPVGAAAPTYPAGGRHYYNRDSGSEWSFTVFDEYLRAFGYNGRPVTWKTDRAVQHIATLAANNAFGGTPDERRACAEGTRAVSYTVVDAVTHYTNALNDATCNDSLRGHPDYGHASYQLARHNFHRFFIMYLSGKADHLPLKAREFFDNFNWQRLGSPARAGLDAVAGLIARIYSVETRPVSNTIPARPGMAIGGNKVTAIQGQLEATQKDRVELVIIRPNIEHNMLGIIMISLFPCLLFAQAPVSLNLTQVS